jgi:hypothetical protein
MGRPFKKDFSLIASACDLFLPDYWKVDVKKV